MVHGLQMALAVLNHIGVTGRKRIKKEKKINIEPRLGEKLSKYPHLTLF